MGVVYGGPSGAWNIGAMGPPDWAAVSRPAAAHMGNIRKILEPLAWSKLVPDFSHSAVAGGGKIGSTDYAAAAVASNGSLIVAYTPVAAKLQIDLSKLVAPGTAQWADPASGKAFGTAVSVANTNSGLFTTPGKNSDNENDWVLIVKTHE